MPPPDRIRRLFLAQQFRLMDYLGGLVRHTQDAEDLFQEVSLTILAKEGDPELPDDPERFAAWCRGVARNHCLHHWRSKKRSRLQFHERLAELADLAFTEAEAAGDDGGVLDFAHRQALAGCLERLPAEGRRVLEERYVADRSCEDIARAQGRAPGGVRMALLRLRDSLRKCIEARLRPAVQP